MSLALAYAPKLLVLMERDLRILMHDKLSLVIIFLNFAIDLFVSGLTFARMVRGFDYFLFIAPGTNLVTAGVIAFQSGREIFIEKALRELSPYHLTLPIPRYLYVLGRLLAGVTKSLIATAPGTIVILALFSPNAPLGLLGPFAIIALFSLAGVALSIMAALAAKRTEVFVTIRSTMQLYTSFLSTVFYPLEYFPSFLVPFALGNPKTWAVQAFRALLAGGAPLQDIIMLGFTSMVLAILASLLYVRSTKM